MMSEANANRDSAPVHPLVRWSFAGRPRQPSPSNLHNVSHHASSRKRFLAEHHHDLDRRGPSIGDGRMIMNRMMKIVVDVVLRNGIGCSIKISTMPVRQDNRPNRKKDVPTDARYSSNHRPICNTVDATIDVPLILRRRPFIEVIAHLSPPVVWNETSPSDAIVNDSISRFCFSRIHPHKVVAGTRG